MHWDMRLHEEHAGFERPDLARGGGEGEAWTHVLATVMWVVMSGVGGRGAGRRSLSARLIELAACGHLRKRRQTAEASSSVGDMWKGLRGTSRRDGQGSGMDVVGRGERSVRVG